MLVKICDSPRPSLLILEQGCHPSRGRFVIEGPWEEGVWAAGTPAGLGRQAGGGGVGCQLGLLHEGDPSPYHTASLGWVMEGLALTTTPRPIIWASRNVCHEI